MYVYMYLYVGLLRVYIYINTSPPCAWSFSAQEPYNEWLFCGN